MKAISRRVANHQPSLSSSRYCYKRDSARGVRARLEGGIARGIFQEGDAGGGETYKGWKAHPRVVLHDGNGW